jgi:ferredoxin/flavodoxin---NADP+ reductase
VNTLRARGAEPVLLEDWRAIDAAEVALGATRGRARTTMHEREALLAAVRAATGR